MTAKLFDAEQIRRRNGQIGEAPVRAELSRRLEERLGEVKGGRHSVDRIFSEESVRQATGGGGHDAVVADMVLPLVEDVPVFMVQCLQRLRPDGLLLMTALGAESFREFRDAWAEIGEPGAHVVPLTDVRDGGALLQRLKLALPVVDRDVMTITFPDFTSLYAGFRAHGVGNFFTGRRQGLVTPCKLRRMEEAYRTLFPREDGRVPVTLEVIYLHGFKAADNQPVAARRGSGKVSLVRIFEDAEPDNN